jgi:hypothetical protein
LEKAVITKAQAEALEHWLETYTGGKEELVKTHILGEEWVDGSEALNGLSLERLIVALYIGYEVECSPIELLASYYNSITIHQEWGLQIKKGIENTLDILELQIEGVNC